MKASAQIRRTVRIALLLCALSVMGNAQWQQLESRSLRDVIKSAHRWIEAGASHVAERQLEVALPLASGPSERKEILLLLMNAAFNDQEYQQSFRWAGMLLGELPSEDERARALYVRGVSGLQTGAEEIARASLDLFLRGRHDAKLEGKAYYWKGLGELRVNQFSSAERDFLRCLDDPAAREYHDASLMSLSTLSDRSGKWGEASEYLRRLLTEFPVSPFAVDAHLQLASLSLRRGDARQSLATIGQIKPQYSYQEEQLLLLRSQSEFLVDDFDNSLRHFREYLRRFPRSKQAPTVRLGLAWSLLNTGDVSDAREEFAILSDGTDSAASAALYQLAMMSLVNGDMATALTKLEESVTRFPYGFYADNAYYQIGLIQYRERHFREARRNFLYVTQLFPESRLVAEAFRMAGECCMALSDFANGQYDFAQVQRSGASSALLAPATFQEGVCLYHLGRFKSSARRFDEYVKNFPTGSRAAEAYVWRGEAEYQDYRFEEAERSFTEALRRFPQTPKLEDAEYGVAWSLFEQKKFSQAADAFDRFIAHHSSSDRRLDASLRKADCFFFLGRFDKASEMYASLASEKSSSQKTEYAAFQLAMSYVQRGEAQRGIDQLQSFLVRFPSSLYNEIALFNIAWTYFSNEQYPNAIKEFKELRRQFPESQLMPRVLFNMGDAFYNLKEHDSARVYYQCVIDQFSSSPLAADALTGLQFTYQAQGRSKEALTAIEKYLGTKPAGITTEELILKKGDLFLGQNDVAEAIHEYQRVLSLSPTRPVKARTYRQLGRSYELQGNPQRAIACYERIVSELSDAEEAPPAALALSINYARLKQYLPAVKALEDFDRRYPDSPLAAEARYHLGLALASAAKSEDALQQFQSVIRQYPNDIFADRSRLRIANLSMNKKRFAAALDTLNVVVSHRGDDLAAEALVLIGDAYAGMKRYRDALQALNDVITQYKDFPLLVERARLATGTCYEQLQDRSGARRAYQEIVKSPVDPDLKKEAEKRLKRLHR